jgi:putative hydrolase of HD superfamily
MNIKRDLSFLYEIGCLRFVQRTWRQFFNADFQNVSEHTLRVIWISLILAKYEKVGNQEKILKMALVHDLPESRCGDVHYVSKQYSQLLEEKAINDIFDATFLGKEFVKIWQEYEERKCIEAKIVKDADTLDVDLELQEQEARGHKLKRVFSVKRKNAVSKKLYTQSAKKFWKEIQNSNPHDWHNVYARNRFNDGDWKTKK